MTKTLPPTAAPAGPVAGAVDILRRGLREAGGPVSLACSFSVEDVVLIDMAQELGLAIGIFALDTGRLNEETYEVADAIVERYRVKIDWFFPQHGSVETLERQKGLFSFRESLENRRECCHIRKVEPLGRALTGLSGWITGLRREQSVTRTDLAPIEVDQVNGGIIKINPLLDEARLTVGEIRKVATSVDEAFAGRGGPMGTMVTNLSMTPGKVNHAVDDMNARIDTLLDKIVVISDNLADISVKTRGIIGDLSTNLDEISQNLKEMTADLKNTQGLAKRLLDPKGSIDTFLNDSNELFNQVDAALKNANGIISELHGLVSESRPQVTSILEKGSTTLDNASDVLQAAKNNPLLKGGVPPRPQQTSPLNNFRDENF